MKLAWGAGLLALTIASCSSFETDEKPGIDVGDAGDAGTPSEASTERTDAEPTAPTDGLIGYWKFDEGAGAVATDSSGSHNDGLITNGAWAIGHSGTAMRSTGPDRVRVAALDGAHFPPTGTLSFWFNVDSFDGKWIFDVYDNKSLVFVSVQRRDNDGVDRVEVQLTKRDPLKTTASTEFVASTPIAVNEWHHVVVVWDTTAHHVDYYLDDQLRGDKVLSADWKPSDETFQFFAPGCCDDAFRGLLDEVRLYNRALSPSEIPMLR